MDCLILDKIEFTYYAKSIVCVEHCMWNIMEDIGGSSVGSKYAVIYRRILRWPKSFYIFHLLISGVCEFCSRVIPEIDKSCIHTKVEGQEAFFEGPLAFFIHLLLVSDSWRVGVQML
jgi:hypothetical protein